MLHSVEFISQRDRPYSRIGCGAASLMMLLRHHSRTGRDGAPPFRIPSYRDLCECLWLNVNPEVKGHHEGMGAYGTDVERALDGMMLTQGRYSKIEGSTELALRRIRHALSYGPVMTAMQGKGFGGAEGHWVVITGQQEVNGSGFCYLDPDLPRRRLLSLSPADFRKQWDECAFFLKYRCKCGT